MVGYTGGNEEFPTYDDMKDHTEVVRLEYDTTKISTIDLLEKIFKTIHPFNFCESLECKQYQDGVWWSSEDQLEAIMVKVKEYEAKEKVFNKFNPRKVRMEISQVKKFYKAEEYHQNNYIKAMKTFPTIETKTVKISKEALKKEL
mmetsp:Transcript_7635/g.8765  ORF Transcript_7635/g.8765 Transcript_7635/m.8765 type:complete len:145 (-) Transcript_7635:164-598(-)